MKTKTRIPTLDDFGEYRQANERLVALQHRLNAIEANRRERRQPQAAAVDELLNASDLGVACELAGSPPATVNGSESRLRRNLQTAVDAQRAVVRQTVVDSARQAAGELQTEYRRRVLAVKSLVRELATANDSVRELLDGLQEQFRGNAGGLRNMCLAGFTKTPGDPNMTRAELFLAECDEHGF